MTTLTADRLTPWCQSNTTSICKASPIVQESIASKSGTRGIDSSSFTPLKTLWEIPTRISQPSSTAVVVHNNNDDPNPTQPVTKLSPTLAENKIVSPSLTPFCDDAACSDYMPQLAEAIAALDQLQQWPSTISIHGQCTAVPSNATWPFAPPFPTPEFLQLSTNPLCDEVACFDYPSELADVIATIARWQWQSIKSIDLGQCNAARKDVTLPSAPPFPANNSQ